MTDPLATAPHSPRDSASALAGVLDAYLAALQAGQTPDRKRLLAEHPDLAAALEPCLAALDFIHHTGQSAADTPARLGDFRVVREIGRGGMGVVYEAEQLSLRRAVALKVLRFAGAGSPEAIPRFRREAEVVARLHHTNIVPIFAVGCEQGVHFYAMQLITGRSLATVEQPSPRQVADWGRQAAEALAHAHQRGVVHRDVKPSNLLLDDEGVVWLTDFGLARGVEETVLTAAGAPLGTPRYMSPEQVAASTPIDHRTDVYSLGATLYELATGRPVFEADSVPQLLAQVRDSEPIPPRQHRPDLPRDLETILLRCLAKSPDDRYASARDLADDLRAFSEDRPIRARRPNFIERARRWLANRRFTAGTVAWTGVAAGVVVLMLVLWGLSLRRELSEGETAQLALAMGPGGLPIELPLTGELLHGGRDELLLPPFAVPTTANLTVPQGTHRLRLSRPGWLSATYALALAPRIANEQTWNVTPTMGPGLIPKGFDDYHRLEVPLQHLWPAPLENAHRAEVIPAGKGHDVIALGGTLKRLGGATGKLLWEASLNNKEPLALAWQPHFGWGDHVGLVTLGSDLVWASRITATLLCQSGQTGGLLWMHAASGPYRKQLTGMVCGLPRVIDVNGDGAADLVALVWLAADQQFHLQAINGRTGQQLWSTPVASSPPAAELRRNHESRPEVSLVRVEGRTVAVCLAGWRLHGIDVRTGKPAFEARPIPWRLIRPVQFADLDGAGNTQALLLHEDEPCRLTLTVLDLARGRIRWEASWPGVPEPLDEEAAVLPHAEPDWPLVVDLDGDGRPEIVVRQVEFSPRYDLPARSRKETRRKQVLETVGVRVLDGATGKERWSRVLGRSRTDQYYGEHPFRVLAAPLRPGDRSRDLIVASLVARWRPGLWHRPELYVDALSGADGSRRWWWRLAVMRPPLSLFGNLGRLVWWQAGPGHDLLLVPLKHRDTGPGEIVNTWALDAHSGTLRHKVPELAEPRVVDLDGDGLPELFGQVAADATSHRPASWRPIRGTAPAMLAEAERFKPGKRFVIDSHRGSFTEEEPEPILPAPQQMEDPRREVPLPWDRFRYLGGMGETNFFAEFVPRILLVLVPVLLVIVPPLAWFGAARQRRLRQQGQSEADLRARSRWWLRWSVYHIAGALLLVLAAGVILIALDEERRPEERYIWKGWYLEAVLAWALACYALMALTSLLALVRKSIRWARGRKAA
jgi:hypothetical protein